MTVQFALQEPRRLLDAGRIEEAFASAQKVTRKYPDDGEAWLMLSVIAQAGEEFDLALKCARKALVCDPENIRIKAQECHALLDTGYRGKALDIARDLFAMEHDNATVLTVIGRVFFTCGEVDVLYELYERARTLEPSEIGHVVNQAAGARYAGRLLEAERLYDEILETRPDHYETHHMRSLVRGQTAGSNHIGVLKGLLKKDQRAADADVYLHYALGKEYEDLEDWERAIVHFEAGAAAKRAAVEYQPEKETDLLKETEQVFSGEVLKGAKPGSSSDEPIFIVGMPRTGTTLVEQILSSHSQVYAAGELQHLGVLQGQLVMEKTGNSTVSGEDLMAWSARLDMKVLGDGYITSTRPRTGKTKHFTDKLPMNFRNIGLIHMALPNAKIIHVRRNPIDACFAIFKTLFGEAFLFSYDLEELADYYIAHVELMNYWHKVLPDKIHIVQYEDLVSDQEGGTRALIEACGLEWEDQCLDFQAQGSATKTASAAQVREPVHTRSVERWRHYEEELAPLIRKLSDAGLTDGDRSS